MRHVRVVGRLDRSFACAGDRLLPAEALRPGGPLPRDVVGALGTAESDGAGAHRLIRDPLGLNKLFWSRADGDVILVAARPIRLVDAGRPLDTIRALPPGRCVDLSAEPAAARSTGLEWDAPPPAQRPRSLDVVAQQVRRRLESYAAALAARYGALPVFVCLSGGLDSTGALILTREHFSSVTAVSFDLARTAGGPSEDRRTAARIARELAVPLLEATVTPDELLDPLDEVLAEGIDWRDFNVHAALVNMALARAIAAVAPPPAIPGGTETSRRGAASGAAATEAAASRTPEPHALVVTGDVMNEFMADYREEKYRGRTYYRLPRLPAGALRAALVRGLETSHRETGVFEARGLPLVQVFAAAAPALLQLPAGVISAPDAKQRLNRMLFGDAVPRYVYTRRKARAQIGDSASGQGVLALCVDRGLDAVLLRRRFAELHGNAPPESLDRFVRGGRYRAALPAWSTGETGEGQAGTPAPAITGLGAAAPPSGRGRTAGGM